MGSVTYAFTHMGNFLLLLLPLLLLLTPPSTSGLISQSHGPYPSLEAQILVLRPNSQPHGPNPNPKAQIPASRNLGLEAGIWTLRLIYRLGGWVGDGDGGEGGENPPYV